MYQRKINPNRVHLTSTLTVPLNGDGSSKVTTMAEYQFKQSKLQCSIDNEAQIKSVYESNIITGYTLSLSGDVAAYKDSYKFGIGIQSQS